MSENKPHLQKSQSNTHEQIPGKRHVLIYNYHGNCVTATRRASASKSPRIPVKELTLQKMGINCLRFTDYYQSQEEENRFRITRKS